MAENKKRTARRFVKAANEVTIEKNWMEHAMGQLKTRKNHEIFRFLNSCWEKNIWAKCSMWEIPSSMRLDRNS